MMPLPTEHNRDGLEDRGIPRAPDFKGFTIDPDHPSGTQPINSLAELLQDLRPELIPVPPQMPDIMVEMSLTTLLTVAPTSTTSDQSTDWKAAAELIPTAKHQL